MNSDTRFKWWMGYIAGLFVATLFASNLSFWAAFLIGIPICWGFMFLADRF